MKTIPLTQEQVAFVSDQDYKYLTQWKWYFLKARRGGYAARDAIINGRRRTLLMHRLVCERAGYSLQYRQCDHRDHNGLNNCRRNLRPATFSQQRQNQLRQRNNQSGYKGVGWHALRRCWRARICVDGRQYHLGLFQSALDAYEAYKLAAHRYFQEFASL